MKKFLTLFLALVALCASAQTRKVQNRPYTDFRPFHFGIQIGAHMQDVDFINVGPQTLTDADGNTQDFLISIDQDRWDPGFNVGVIGEFRLSTNFQLRIAPAIYFGSRHITFRNLRPYTLPSSDEQALPQLLFDDGDEQGETPEEPSSQRITEVRQNIKAAYITSAVDLIFAAPRFNNYRPYIMVGLVPTLNLTGSSTDFIRLKPYQTFAEIGFGLDRYLPYFKCRPELKFMFGLGNALNTSHSLVMKDINSIAHARSASSAKTRMITLTFFFE